MQRKKWGLKTAVGAAAISAVSLSWVGQGLTVARAEPGEHGGEGGHHKITLTAAQRTQINAAIVARDTAIAAALTAFATTEGQILAGNATSGDLTTAQQTALRAAEQTRNQAVNAALKQYDQTVRNILQGITPGTMTGVPVSQAIANVKQSLIELRFNAPLDQTTASNAANYAVTVNGTAVPVQGATANARGVVTLGLASGALKSGDQVGITWSNLKDLHGTATAGSITVTAH